MATYVDMYEIQCPVPVAVTVVPTPILESSTSSTVSTAAMIAKFRPTPKDIIGRIAPHVLEEHGMKRRKPRSPPRSPQMYAESKINAGGAMKEPSPLRFSAVISCEWEKEHSMIYFEQPDHHAAIMSDITLFPVATRPVAPPLPSKDPQFMSRFDTGTGEQLAKVSKAEKGKVRSYVHILRSIARLKPTTRSHQ